MNEIKEHQCFVYKCKEPLKTICGRFASCDEHDELFHQEFIEPMIPTSPDFDTLVRYDDDVYEIVVEEKKKKLQKQFIAKMRAIRNGDQ